MARGRGPGGGFERDPYAAFRPWSDAVLELRAVVVGHAAPVELALGRGELRELTATDAASARALAETAAGLAVPRSGEVLWSGTSLAGLRPRARVAARRGTVGLLPADPELIGHLSGYENVLLAALPGGRAQQAADRAGELIEELGVGEQGHEPADSLDGDRARLVAVARALLLDPLVLVAVDPTPAVLDVLRARTGSGLAVLAVITAAAASGR